MKKHLNKLTEKRDFFNEKLKERLDKMPPAMRLNTILALITVYALITFILLIQGFSPHAGHRLEVEHIEPAKIVDTPVKKPTPNDTVYNYQSHK